MSPTVIRFRCHRCAKVHEVAAGRAGTIAVCPCCFGPLRVPDLAVVRGGGILTAEAPESLPRAVEVPVVPAVEQPVAEADTVERDRRVVWGVGLGVVVSLIGTIGMVAGLSLLQAARRSGDRLAAAAPWAAPIVARQRPRPDSPVSRPEPKLVSLPTPARMPIAAAGPAPAVPAPAELVKPRVVRRRQTRDQEELRKELEALPELGLNGNTAVLLLAQHGVTLSSTTAERRRTRSGLAPGRPKLPKFDRSSAVNIGQLPPPQVAHATFERIRKMQPELRDLPWRMGDDCHLAREPAEKLQTLSRLLRAFLAATTPLGDTRPDSEQLRRVLFGERLENLPLVGRRIIGAFARSGTPLATESGDDWADPAAIPALLQLLMAERTSTRRVLVDVLEKIPGPAADKALARLAIFDIAPEVRGQATLALRDRPVESYSPILLQGLRYPWPPAADHAAEALVNLDDRQAIPSLIELLDKPDPQGPTTVLRRGQRTTVYPQLVKINHLKNCLLCHDPSRSAETDLVRGRVPSPGEPLPPPVQYYGASQRGLFVRAETTYLRQDFSVTQPVEDADPWPTQQRFDYLVLDGRAPASRPNPLQSVATESLTADELAPFDPPPDPVHPYPQRESVLFALRQLTGKDPGTTATAWRDAVQPARPVSTDEPAEQ